MSLYEAVERTGLERGMGTKLGQAFDKRHGALQVNFPFGKVAWRASLDRFVPPGLTVAATALPLGLFRTKRSFMQSQALRCLYIVLLP